MSPSAFLQLGVRDATQADLPLLAGKYLTESLLRDYLRLAQESALRCLVLVRELEIIGFSLLVFRRPEFWPSAGNTRRLPEITSLEVCESQRGQGFGTQFMRAIEAEAAKAGHEHLYLTVSPANNPRAYTWYRRLGYQQLQPEPYHVAWEFADTQGNVHRGENWLIDMMKQL